MTNPEAILQIERLLGRAEFRGALGLQAGALPFPLDAGQRDRLSALVDERLAQLAQALLEEAMASDDVVDAPSALAFLRDRREFLGDLLSRPQAERLQAAFEQRVATWG